MRVFIMPTSSWAFATEYVYFLTRFGISPSPARILPGFKNCKNLAAFDILNLIGVLKQFTESESKKKRTVEN